MEKIRTFELDRWSEPDTHLKEKGMLPDEYFLYDVDMRTKARELPDFNFALCVPILAAVKGFIWILT